MEMGLLSIRPLSLAGAPCVCNGAGLRGWIPVILEKKSLAKWQSKDEFVMLQAARWNS